MYINALITCTCKRWDTKLMLNYELMILIETDKLYSDLPKNPH
mgnify:CR=1 FL=1